MIEIINGKIISKESDKVIISCNGVGYGIKISAFTYSALGKIGENQQLYTFLKVREDDMSLFGFIDQKEKTLFNLLSSVSGIGPKTALQFLSDIKFDRIYTAVLNEDITLLSTVKGVGKKTAKKMVLELKDKIMKLSLSISGSISNSQLSSSSSDAVKALITLGYNQNTASTAVSKVLKENGNNLTTNEIITKVLKARTKI